MIRVHCATVCIELLTCCCAVCPLHAGRDSARGCCVQCIEYTRGRRRTPLWIAFSAPRACRSANALLIPPAQNRHLLPIISSERVGGGYAMLIVCLSACLCAWSSVLRTPAGLRFVDSQPVIYSLTEIQIEIESWNACILETKQRTSASFEAEYLKKRLVIGTELL